MKKILLLAAVLMAATAAMAGSVDLSTARARATSFLLNHAVGGRLMSSPAVVRWTHEVKNSSNAALVAYYIVNTDKGYVIVAGDDRARDILAYGDGPLTSMNDLPASMRFFLDLYQEQMEYLQAHPGMVVSKLTQSSGVTVEPLLTTTWAQGRPYYNQTPVSGGTHCQVGCSAVSLAQVMNYWKYPESSPALPGYTGADFGITVPELPAYTFDWSHLRNYYKNDNWSEAEVAAVSHLMRYVGQAEQMDYSTQASGANEDQIMQAIRTFGYDSGAHYVLKQSYDDMSDIYSDEAWTAMIQAELAAGRPLIYCAYNITTDQSAANGHSFNVDGYDAANDTYHVNFGWGGNNNGYFALNTFGSGITIYKYWQLMFVGMQPPTGPAVPRILASPAALSMACYAGETATATFNVVGMDLTDDITVTINDENGVFTADVDAISVEQAGGKTVTITYAPLAVGEHTATVTLASAGAEAVSVALTGTATAAPLTVFTPMMLPADSAYIGLTEFRADWTDETVSENVAGYTLEVNAKPAGPATGTLIAQADWSDVPSSGNAANYLPDGWGYNGYLYLEGGAISISSGSYITTNALDLTGFDKITVVVCAQNYYTWTNSALSVKTSVDEQYIELADDYANYTVVLNCSESEQVQLYAESYYPTIQSVQIYAGEVAAPQFMASETGDATYRLITGIADKSYTVKDLEAAGTFLYRVKAVYIDGTESAWSNKQEVTLFENGHGYRPGDVNHDGSVSIADVTALIDYLLSGDGDICLICADFNGDTNITIADVTALIDKLLSGN